MIRRKLTGGLYGAAAAACYGMNPLFALPLINNGIGVNSVLFYRYVFAVIIFGIWVKFFKKISLKITLKEFIPLFIMGIMFSLSSLTLFMSYTYIDAGIASTILFIYPVLVAVLMAIFFKERLCLSAILSIILTTIGIGLLYNGKLGQSLNLTGVILVFLSALTYAIYIIGVKNIPAIKHINTTKLSFYVMLFGLLVYIVNLNFCTELQIIHSPVLWLSALALSILPTIVSLEAMTISIKLIGSTPAAVLGALEPVTALFFGVVVFHEQLTPRIITGIITILTAVLMIILAKDKIRRA